jgi:DNA-binding IclR family transcriptional regulator
MELADVRHVSKALLGNAYLLEVAAAVAALAEGQFFAREIARRLGVADSLVAPALQRLESGGLLKRLPKVANYQVFERVPSVFWAFSQELLDEATGRSPWSGV